MYLETIYVLSQKKNFVRAIDICEEMGYSKPSVSRAMGKLKSEGYIKIDPQGYITLTRKGESIAKNIYEKRVVLKDFIMSLGVNEKTAEADACRIEHVLSDESFAALKKARNS